ncbi:hypothetical protein V8C34DRAFT_193191 [Trichoderma compactum]
MAFSALKDSYMALGFFIFCVNPLFGLEVHIYCNTLTYKTTTFVSKDSVQSAIFPRGPAQWTCIAASSPYSWPPFA